MAGTSIYSVYRRTARAAAKQQVVKKTSTVDVERARKNFAYFCDVVGGKPPAKHHLEWHKFLCTGDDSECLKGIAGPNVDILAPRGSAKSTVLGLYTAWAIGIHALNKMPLKILYISYTVDICRAPAGALQISTGEEEFSVCCAGLKGAVTSKRSHLCIIDDAIKSADDIKNKDIRQAMEDNWNAVIVPTMFEGARAICLGTRFRHDDIHSSTFLPANGWKQIVQSAITVDKEGEEISYWPDMWSLDYLSQRRRIAPIAFSFQYQNQVVQTSELSLSPDLIVKGTISTDFDALGVGVDLSAGVRERNDYTVFVMGGRVKDKIHIVDCKRVRVMGNLEKLELLMEMMEEWGVIMKDGKNYFPTGTSLHIWSEAVAYQASLEADFKRICQTEQGLYNLIWHPVKGFRGDKVARFRGIMGLFEQRKIIFNKYRKFGALTDEIVNFGVSSHDDCVDALVWLCNGLMTRGKLELEY